MNISDKAIQAAAKADYETNPGMLEWEEMDPRDQEIFVHSAEAALKAAAPFIAAQALRDAALDVDRGYSDAYHHGKGDLKRWEKLHEASYWLRDRADEVEQ